MNSELMSDLALFVEVARTRRFSAAALSPNIQASTLYLPPVLEACTRAHPALDVELDIQGSG